MAKIPATTTPRTRVRLAAAQNGTGAPDAAALILWEQLRARLVTGDNGVDLPVQMFDLWVRHVTGASQDEAEAAPAAPSPQVPIDPSLLHPNHNTAT